MEEHVTNILSHLDIMTTEFRHKYILVKSTRDAIHQSYCVDFGPYSYEVIYSYAAHVTFRCIYNTQTLIKYNIDFGYNNLFFDGLVLASSPGAALKDYLYLNKRQKDWHTLLEAMSKFFETNKEDMISKQSLGKSMPLRDIAKSIDVWTNELKDKYACIKNLEASYTKMDVLNLLDVAFSAYSSFSPKSWADKWYIVEESIGDLKANMLYYEEDGRRDKIYLWIEYCKDNMSVEILEIEWNLDINKYKVVSNPHLPIPDGFDEGFAKFKLLESLMA